MAPKGSAPKPTLRAAVEGLLAAEQRSDFSASYTFLDAAGRAKYPEASDWEDRRTGLSPVTGFSIDAAASTPTSVVAVVQHKPGLDPFIGLSPAEERQTWQGSETPDGFLVDPDPKVVFVAPPESGIAATVTAWATAVQACDQAKGVTYQAVPTLYGESDGASSLCGSKGALRVGSVGPLLAGPASADLVAQYSSDVLAWARTVPVSGAATFVVIVAPIGAGWKVLGVADRG